MTRRRGKGEGSVYKVGKGYRGYVSLPTDNWDRPRQYFSGPTKKEVQDKIREAKVRIDQGLPLPDQTLTLSDLIEQFICDGFDRELSPKTVYDHTGVLRIPQRKIGNIKVVRLKPSDVTKLCRDMLDDGYSTSYAGRVRNMLNQVLAYAQAEGLVARNVADLSPTIKYRKKSRNKPRMTLEEAKRLLRSAAGDRLYAAIVVMLMLGLRPGELTGLPWRAIDLEARTLCVGQSLKNHPGSRHIGAVKRTPAAERTVRVPKRAAAALAAHQLAQKAEAQAAGPTWNNADDLVFTTTVGTPIDPANLRRTVRRLVAAAGIDKHVVPYDFRHASTSLMNKAKVDPRSVANVTGNHVRTSLSTYTHVMDEVLEDAADPMDEMFSDL